MTVSGASINAQTLVFSSKVADGYVIISNTESAKLNELSFDYKSYGDDDFSENGIERALKIYINEDTSPIHTLPLVGKVKTTVNVKIDIDKDVKSVKIHRDYGDKTNTYPRFCIDNIKLTGSL